MPTRDPRPVEAPAAPSPARPKLTLSDVATALGVSRTTVSNAFNRPEQLSEVLRERILATARQLGYFGPDPMARALRRNELREVAVVFHHDLGYAMSDPSSIEFLRGVATELDRRRLTLQLIPKMGRKLVPAAAFQTTADMLIVHAEIGPQFVPELLGVHKPLVLVDTHVAGIPSVRTRDREAAELAMRHALARRPDRIVVLCFLHGEADRRRAIAGHALPPSAYVGTERTVGYVDALRAAGFPKEQVLWLEVDDQWPDSAGDRLQTLRTQLPAGARVAVVSMSDRMALSAQAALKAWPDIEIASIVGFDDIPAAAAAGLTTIRLDPFLKGRLAARVVLEGVAPDTLPGELVVRET